MSNFVSKYISGKEYKWLWFLSTFVGGLIPIILSMIFSSETQDWVWFSLYSAQDLAFLGITMNIANFNLVSKLTFNEKDTFIQLSTVLLIIEAVMLGYIYFRKSEGTSVIFGIILHLLVVASVFFSASVNNFVHEVVIKKGT